MPLFEEGGVNLCCIDKVTDSRSRRISDVNSRECEYAFIYLCTQAVSECVCVCAHRQFALLVMFSKSQRSCSRLLWECLRKAEGGVARGERGR